MSYVLKPGHSGPKIFELQEILIASGDLPATDAKGRPVRPDRPSGYHRLSKEKRIASRNNRGLTPILLVN